MRGIIYFSDRLTETVNNCCGLGSIFIFEGSAKGSGKIFFFIQTHGLLNSVPAPRQKTFVFTGTWDQYIDSISPINVEITLMRRIPPWEGKRRLCSQSGGGRRKRKVYYSSAPLKPVHLNSVFNLLNTVNSFHTPFLILTTSKFY